MGREVLRSMPTTMLSDVQAIYDETKIRGETKAKMILDRTVEVERQIEAVVFTREELKRNRENLQRNVAEGFAQLRKELEERERYLMETACDFERAKQPELDHLVSLLNAKKNELLHGYHDAEEHLRMQDKFTFISQAADFEKQMQHYLDMDLGVDGVDINDGRGVQWETHQRNIHEIDFKGGMGQTGGGTGHYQRLERSLPPPPAVHSTPVTYQTEVRTPVHVEEHHHVEQREHSPKPHSPDGSNAIYINGLAPDTTEHDIEEAFSQFGHIKMINARHIGNGGFAFVFFEDEAGAASALVSPRVQVKDRTANVLAKQQILSGGGRWL